MIIAITKPENLELMSRNPVMTEASCGKVISLAKLMDTGTAGIYKQPLMKEIVTMAILSPVWKIYTPSERIKKEPITQILKSKRFLCVLFKM